MSEEDKLISGNYRYPIKVIHEYENGGENEYLIEVLPHYEHVHHVDVDDKATLIKPALKSVLPVECFYKAWPDRTRWKCPYCRIFLSAKSAVDRHCNARFSKDSETIPACYKRRESEPAIDGTYQPAKKAPIKVIYKECKTGCTNCTDATNSAAEN